MGEMFEVKGMPYDARQPITRSSSWGDLGGI